VNYREEMEEGTMFLEPEWLDDAIVGVINLNGFEVLAYGYQRLIQAFVKNDEMDYESATEWVEHNTIRALPYMGEQAPVVIYLREWDGAAV
jgi:hypothetical protein